MGSFSLFHWRTWQEAARTRHCCWEDNRGSWLATNTVQQVELRPAWTNLPFPITDCIRGGLKADHQFTFYLGFFQLFIPDIFITDRLLVDYIPSQYHNHSLLGFGWQHEYHYTCFYLLPLHLTNFCTRDLPVTFHLTASFFFHSVTCLDIL